MMRKFALALALCVVGVFALSGLAHADGTTQATNTTVRLGAHTSFDRTYNWLVTKTDDQHSSVTIAQNEVFSITYTITVSNATPASTDSNWLVQDGIVMDAGSNQFTLTGLNQVTATALQGATSTAGSISVCSTDDLYNPPWDFSTPFTGSHFLCHYVIPLPNGSAGTVNGTATFSDGSTQTGSTAFNFTTNLGPGQPTIKDGSVQVVDSQGGVLGTLTAPIHPTTFTYSVPVPSSTCGSFDMPNTVNLLDTATGASVGSASDTVHVTVTCPHVNGCTLTQGYWKTHSIYGPAAKPDPTWNLLPSGPDTSFFLSGQTWLQVFNTSPSGGNAYYVLAHQYEAAILNQLNGASSTSAVDAALAAATSFFNTYTPAQAAALAKNGSVRQAALAAATTLDNYNSGLIGPGHCSENS